MDEKEIILKDVEKLKELGFQDGYERAIKVLETNPQNIDYLDAVKLPVYYEAYLAGIEEAKRQFGIVPQDTPTKK